MGKQTYVRLVEHGKQQNPLLHISAAAAAAAAGKVRPKVSHEFNRVQPELWKSSWQQLWKSNLQQLISYYYKGWEWS